MAEQNDNPGSNVHPAGIQPNHEALLFDEQTVLSRGQSMEAGDKSERISDSSVRAEDSGNENIQAALGGGDVRDRSAQDQGNIHQNGLGIVSGTGNEVSCRSIY